MFSKASYTNDSGKVIKLKQSMKTGKGDFSIKGAPKSGYITIYGVNNYKGSAKVKVY